MIPNTWQFGVPEDDFLQNFLSKWYLRKLWCNFYNLRKSVNLRKTFITAYLFVLKCLTEIG